jgi:hypothetical protein
VRIKGFGLAACVVARLGWVNTREFPPFGENLFSANVEFGKGIDLVLSPGQLSRMPCAAPCRPSLAALALTCAALPGSIPAASAALRSVILPAMTRCAKAISLSVIGLSNGPLGIDFMDLVGRTGKVQMVGEAGLEPTTPGLEGRCSIQLSYSPDSDIVSSSVS